MEYFPSVSSSFTGSCSDSNKEKKKSGKKSKGVVKLSTDPQSVAARERRHRISERFKILQSMVPGGTKMDTVSMLDEAIHYVKFLKTQIWLHQTMISFVDDESSLFFANSLPSQETMYTNNFTNLNSAEMPPQPLQLQLPPMPKLSDCCFHGDVRALPYEHAYTKYE